MKILCQQLILVAVLITGRADAERTRRDEEPVPLSSQVKAYPVSSLNLNAEAQLNAETGEGSIGKVLNLKAPNGFSFDDSNEGGESFETEANVVTGYDGTDQFNGANTLYYDKNPEFMTTIHASASADFITGDKTKNRAVVKNDAANQSILQAQFRQEAQYGAESQADTVIQENQETSKNLPPAQEMMQLPYGTSPLVRPSVNSGDIKNTLKANPILGASNEPLNKPGQEPGSWYARLPNRVPSSNPNYAYGSPFVVTTPQVDRATYPSIAYTGPVHKYTPFYQVSDTGIKKNKPTANGYEVTRNSNWIPYQKGNPTKSLVTNDVAYTKNNNWNPYTKPAEGETLLQAAEEIQSRAETITNLAAQENVNRSPHLISYQNKNLNKPLVPFQNGYNNNENWNPYTKPAEGETLVQVEQDIQSNGKTDANIAAQGNGNQSPNLLQYQEENPNKPLLPINVFQNGYNDNNNNNNWNPYTKPAEGETLVQAEQEIQSNGKTDANIAAQGNGNQSPNLLQYQKENSNKPLVPINVFQNGYNDNNNNNWNPYTKPAEGETLVEVEQEIQSNGKIDANIAAQGNGNQSPNLLQYQKENPNKPLVPINVFQNGYNDDNNNNNWDPYTKPAEGETLVQVEQEIQSNGKIDANIAAQGNGNQSPNLLQYQKENPNKPLLPINVFQNGYNDNNNNNNWNPYTKPAEGETLVQAEQEIQSNGKTDANIAAQGNGNQSPNLLQYQKENPNKPLVPINVFQNGYNDDNNNNNWNPYTKPAEGETLVQVEQEIQSNGKIDANIAAQGNGNQSPNLLQYQKENPNKPLVPINVFQNGYNDNNNNNNWNPYTKPAEGETLVQVEQEIQSNGKIDANIAAQGNGNQSPNLLQYQKENPNKPLLPINVFQNGYNDNNNNNNWNPYTKPAEGETLVQAEQEIQSNGKTDANIAAQGNGNQSPNLLQYQKENPNKPLVPINVFQNGYNDDNNNNNWNPYTKPAEGETLVQVEQEIQSNGKIDANIAAQGNGNQSPNLLQYQKENPNKPLVPINVFQNGYNDNNNNNNWNPYTKPAEGETLVQAEQEIQSNGKTDANIAAQGNGNQSPNLLQYQTENSNKPLVPINVFQNGYNDNNNNNWNPYTKPAEGETLVQVEQEIQSNRKTDANLVAQGNGNQSPNLLQYQKGNPNKPLVPINVFQNDYNDNNNWNPYTKPAEGENLVQAEGKSHYREKTVADLAAQENDDRSPKLFPNQKENLNKPLVPINVFQNGYNNNKNWNPYTKPTEGETLVQMEEEIQSNGKAEANIATQKNGNRDIVSLNSYNNNKNWNPYTKPAERDTLIQAEGEIQSNQLNSGMLYNPSTQANIVAQSNGGFHYSEENKITSAAEVAAEAPTNIASSYSGGLAATQMSKGMNSGAQESGSSIYGNTNKYNNVYLYGPGNTNSHLQNGAQFGAVIGVEPPGQAGPVVEARFGQTTHPAHRPLSAFGYKQPNGWNHW